MININHVNYFWTLSAWASIFQMKFFVTRPLRVTLWPWHWSLTHFLKTLTLPITSKQWVLELWYSPWVFLVTKPFCGYTSDMSSWKSVYFKHLETIKWAKIRNENYCNILSKEQYTKQVCSNLFPCKLITLMTLHICSTFVDSPLQCDLDLAVWPIFFQFSILLITLNIEC